MGKAANVQPEVAADTRLLLTVEEVAERLAIGKTLAWELVWSGKLPSVRIGRCVRVPLGALEAWIAERTEGIG